MTRGILDAETALENFKKAADLAAASGEKMPPRVGVAVRAMEADIEAATTRLGVLKDRMGDVKDRANSMGAEFQSLQGTFSSTSGLFGKMESEGKGLTGALGMAGQAVVGLGAGFVLGKQLAKDLTDEIQKLTEKSLAHMEKTAATRLELQKFDQALELAKSGVIKMGSSTHELIQNYDAYIVSQGRATDAVDKFGKTVAGLQVPKTFAQIEAEGAKMGAELEGAFKRSAAEGLAWAKANETTLRGMEKSYRDFGEAVPEGIRKALDALNAYQAGLKRTAEFQAEANKKTAEMPGLIATVGAALQKVREDFQKEADAARKSTAEVVGSRDEQIRALRAQGLTEEEYFKRKQAILAESDKAIQENAAKETAAREKEKAALVAISEQYRMTGAALAELNQKYLDGQKQKAEAARSDEALAVLQDTLATAVATTTEKTTEANTSWLGLHDTLRKVGTAVEELAN